ncbi:MAG: hypothetical protein AB7G48_18060 [Nitrospiraceae bacterium]
MRIPQKKRAPLLLREDEEPDRVDLSNLPMWKPVIQEDDVPTVGDCLSSNKGAAALAIMAEDEAACLGLKPVARIVGYLGSVLAPEWFTLAPVEAITLVLKKTDLCPGETELFAINEASSSRSDRCPPRDDTTPCGGGARG